MMKDEATASEHRWSPGDMYVENASSRKGSYTGIWLLSNERDSTVEKPRNQFS